MTLSRRRTCWVIFIILGLLVADQVFKIWVKTNMSLHETIPVLGNWFNLTFIENEGMAFGMAFGGSFGKLVLSLFRIVLVVVLSVYIHRLIRRPDTPWGVLIGFALIIVGALGNIFDCAFYGMCFTESTVTEVAQIVPFGQGYSSFLHGKVVDMLFFPIIETQWPSWFPIWGGRPLVFFRFIFNIADACISVGTFYMVLFQYRFFAVDHKKSKSN